MSSARLVVLTGLASSLVACNDGANIWSEDEIREIAREETQYIAETVDHNAASSSDLKDRVDALESRVDELEDENRKLKRELRYMSY